MVASLDRFIYIYINFIFIYNGLGLCFGSHLVFEPFENRTIRKPDQADHSKTGHVRFSDPHCTD